jgi:hypothetical protein
MPHLFSGLNQKRQSGVITGGTFTVGGKGRGSSNRMVSHCRSNSENPSECSNQIINIAAAAPPPKEKPKEAPKEEDILFNLSSFDKLPIPNKYKSALFLAANRWNTFIKFNMDTVRFIRSKKTVDRDYKNWNGIELTGFSLFTNPTYIAQTEAIYFALSSLNVSFTLKVDDAQMINKKYKQDDINDVMTHELGHALGFTYMKTTVNSEANKAELLLNTRTLQAFKINSRDYSENPQHPIGLIKDYFPYTVQFFDDIGGTCNNENKKVTGTNLPLDDNKAGGLHFASKTYSSVELVPNTFISKYYKRGLSNEIMSPSHIQGQKYYISPLSICFLLELYTNYDGKNYYNYTQKNSQLGSEVKNYTITRPGLHITFNSTINPIIIKNGDKSIDDEIIDDEIIDNEIIDDKSFNDEIIDDENTIHLNCSCKIIYKEIIN